MYIKFEKRGKFKITSEKHHYQRTFLIILNKVTRQEAEERRQQEAISRGIPCIIMEMEKVDGVWEK